MLRILLYAAPLILAIYALIDCVQTERPAVRSLPKPAWLAVIVLAPVFGPVAWLLAGKDPATGSRSGRIRPAGPPPGRPVAPDDDPEFLRRLGEVNRSRDRRPGGPPKAGPARRERDELPEGEGPEPDDGSAPTH
jgi:hypothetical protein